MSTPVNVSHRHHDSFRPEAVREGKGTSATSTDRNWSSRAKSRDTETKTKSSYEQAISRNEYDRHHKEHSSRSDVQRYEPSREATKRSDNYANHKRADNVYRDHSSKQVSSTQRSDPKVLPYNMEIAKAA